MGQAQRPQTKVGSRVGDAAQEVLNSVNGLLDKYLAEVKLEQEGQKLFPHSSQTTSRCLRRILPLPRALQDPCLS